MSETSLSCYHCGQPVPAGATYPVVLNGQARLMCCPGCQAVATAIVEGGLDSFYSYRTQANPRPNNPSDLSTLTRFNIYDAPDIQAEFVIPFDDETAQANLLLEGISCAACSWLIETHLKKHSAVKSVAVNITTHRCTLVWNTGTPLSILLNELASIGYTPRPATDDHQQQLIKKENRIALFRIGVAGFGMMQAMMVAVGMYTGATGFWLDFLRWLSMIVATPVVFFSAWPFFKNAWNSVKLRRLIMDVPVALAIGLAYAASVWATVTSTGEVYFESVSMFTFFLLLGRYVELRARHRNRLAFGNLAQLMPLSACCLIATDSGWKEEQVPLKALQVGDRVRVDAGETFPCDGEIVDGKSSVVEALLTGESRPIEKTIGDHVIAGTLNHHSPLVVRVQALGGKTQLSAIERLAVAAEDDKPKQVKVADNIARFFIARLLVICAAVFAFWMWYRPEDAFWITLSVLVVTCPCALALAMPAALSAATANLRKRGFLVARGHVIEGLEGITRIILDKTGTLTKGEFAVKQVVPFDGIQDNSAHWLACAAALEVGSNHPLAHAFQPWRDTYTAEDIEQTLSGGVSGTISGMYYRLGNVGFVRDLHPTSRLIPPDSRLSWLLLADNHSPLAWIGLDDELRPDAGLLIENLRSQGIAIELLSGDQSHVVERVAKELGIADFTAEATPSDKLSQVKKRQAEGDKILMVGDGINDVPVLSGADVSIAMASASDLAQTRADALLLNNHLMVISQAITIAHQTKHIIQQNLRFSLTYNLFAIPLAAAGYVPPWLAAIGMTLSSLVVIFNALRLTKV